MGFDIETAVDKVVGGFSRVFGSRNERVLRRIEPTAQQVNEIELGYQKLTDAELRAKTDEFKARLAGGKATLEDLLPEAFAAVKNACRRLCGKSWEVTGTPYTWHMVPFDVQVVGGVVLHRGMIAEMATGEGKTLVATMPVYLNALSGEGVHVVTVNDYLARRDAQWMGPVYESLGLTVGAIQSEMDPFTRQPIYGSDITYGTNNEFGFDYLRDNMKPAKELQVQRALHYAIVDEVDSILIDEARTPLIISGPTTETTDKYGRAWEIARRLKGISKQGAEYREKWEEDILRNPEVETELEEQYDYVVDEKQHSVRITESGTKKYEEMLGLDTDRLYTGELTTGQQEELIRSGHMDWEHLLTQGLRAKELYRRDHHYIIKEGKVVIVDEHTGRLMADRTWSEGLHQAIEAKEHLKIREENQTLATITLQNYFRMYKKLAGMTGTAMTEATEFWSIYKLDVVNIPTNMPMKRTNYADQVFLTEKEKYKAIIDEIVEMHETGRPLLVGTISIENSERISEMLGRQGVKHEVLNAKQHEREANIVAKAGQGANVTIATNMAGRGTDIVLGEEVAGLGGLHIIGTERHEARRIDNQLRGRAGRQGDPGSSRFFLSLEDNVMRLFAGDWVRAMLGKMGMGDGMPIESKLVSRQIEKAQRRVEERNFQIRKDLLEYDGVMDEQRKIVYGQRQEILGGQDVKEKVEDMIAEVMDEAVEKYASPEDRREKRDYERLSAWLTAKFTLGISVKSVEALDEEGSLSEKLLGKLDEQYQARETQMGTPAMRELERYLLLQVMDTRWKDHLYAMDQLRGAIGLRAFGQKDPKTMYRLEAYEMFESMIEEIREQVTDLIMKVQLVDNSQQRAQSVWEVSELTKNEFNTFDEQREAGVAGSQSGEPRKPFVRGKERVGRNDPCPCGSGKKYKKCCGANG